MSIYNNLKKVWIDIDIPRASDEKIQEIFKKALEMAMHDDIDLQDFELSHDDIQELNQNPPTPITHSLFENIPDLYPPLDDFEPLPLDIPDWTQDEDNLLLDTYHHLNDVGFISDELWSRVAYKMNRDFEHYSSNYPPKTPQQLKDRVFELSNDHDYFQEIAMLTEDLESIPDDDTTDLHNDYYDDPTANYCDWCNLNVYDCNC